MYHLIYYLRIFLIILASAAIMVAIGGAIGFVLGGAFVVVANALNTAHELVFVKPNNAVQLPGKLTIEARKPLGIKLNDRDFYLDRKETLTVVIPEEANAIGFVLATQPEDDVLDAKEIQ